MSTLQILFKTMTCAVLLSIEHDKYPSKNATKLLSGLHSKTKVGENVENAHSLTSE